ncbi:hook-length control protein FliK [Butyrivibrio proteoclasticus]|uniref:Hook-length control protein FliK n=1 Tax=Butyrivibrio proteoclasticus TaxID=43305 RepID=A0A1I5U3H3_9FIRM|nr:flagellar hook-length control protein FliK [Butyrivibrio proteoclasticus]SFP89741.1 hook-length control protein FliK [Butyrivibrio proteoclasticus]
MSGISSVSQSNQPIVLNGSSLQVPQGQGEALNLKNGSVIQGMVMSVNDTTDGKMVSINVSGYEISAKLQDGMDLKEGQSLQFAVKGLSSKAVTIMPLYENTTAIQSTIKALTAAGLETTPENVQMVKDMMEAGLPIDKASLQEMSKNLNLFSDTSVSTLVEMKSLNIPINDNNINGFESYKSYEHQVVNEMEDIMNALPDTFNMLMSDGKETKAMNLYGSVLKLFGKENPTAIQTQESPMALQTQENPSSLQGPKNPTVLQTNENPVALQEQENAETLQGMVKEATSNNSAIVMGDVVFENEASLKMTDSGKEIIDNSVPSEQNLSVEIDVSKQNNLIEKETASIKGNIFSNEFIDNLKNLGISDESISKLLTSDSKELLNELAKSFEEADLTNRVESAAWKKLFVSEEYNRIIKENISEQWLLKPSEVEDKENIQNLYQRLNNQVKHLAETVNNSGLSDTKLGQSLNNLSNNLDFMNQLNHIFQYVQLPLQMAGQNVHGDLYVYRNKNKRMSEDGSVSAVLHLDMDNLGPIDVYVKMLEKKVTTNFYVSDDSILDLINDNIHILNERLEKRGYSMNVILKLQDDMDGEDAAVDEMFEVTKTPILSTTSFDARA